MYISEESLMSILKGIIRDLIADDEIDAQKVCNILSENGIGEYEMKDQLSLELSYNRLIERGGEFDPYYNWDYDLDGPDPSGYTPYPQDLEDE